MSGQSTNNDNWISIFNGQNLEGWIPKVTGYRVGENPLDGFRVENGILKVDYSKFAAFNGRFGHLFYHEKLSSYMLRVEYRFVGEVLPDGTRILFSQQRNHDSFAITMEYGYNPKLACFT
ncbi:MAG: DUF1080 domain-containing protein [Bacteroidales bacterium]|nr:DUF1080 domain-containing protein [Bacteroidales bacterium]